eukprot:CAMPEP_0198355168 /NCGR_PEP_ID=MMETSP1450-20131203/118145_1 /TAXON_ID=753684 ORGANISM="Madagascaria erythrocladiodes, Strain CCMP3234" /NCGR_SAMPLE_ID=MMETSP1450 /ASSEMBLY_ACC=CAM_ASM_001115 /LENGTH=109 /DNA_ID=CAMNT_0044061511 /DNA_START=1 /DNA_END=330 /DNA_ORIENTATION=+
MEVTSVPDTDANDYLNKPLVYLYRLSEGTIASESHVVRCAAMAGVPKPILQRSLQIKKHLTENEPVDINLIDSTWVQKFKRQHDVAVAFSQLDLEACTDARSMLRRLLA